MKTIATRTALFMLLVPGLLIGVLPVWLMSTEPALFSFGFLRWLAIPLWAAGAAAMIWCARAFTVHGRGTPSPTDPPRELVVCGLYAWVRNPIYDSAVIFLLGHVLWHPALPILLMPTIVAVSSLLFVIIYEEPHLRRLFGARYEAYCASVPRWLPRMKRSGS